MQETLFNLITQGTGNLFKDGTKYHIYPKHIPDGKLPANALIYNVISQSIQYKQISSEVQLTVVSATYQEMTDRVRALIELLSNKRWSVTGDLIASNIRNITELDYDTENHYYLTAVNIFVKSIK